MLPSLTATLTTVPSISAVTMLPVMVSPSITAAVSASAVGASFVPVTVIVRFVVVVAPSLSVTVTGTTISKVSSTAKLS